MGTKPNVRSNHNSEVNMFDNIITRRDFMRQTAYTALGAAVIGISFQNAPKTRVVLVRRENIWLSQSQLNQTVVQEILDEAVMALFNTDDPVKAFKMIIKPDDIVGIKTNQWNMLPTPKELERAIEQRVIDAGVKKENIGIADWPARTLPVFKNSTALINVRPMRSHYWAGVGGCIKIYINFDPTPSKYHPDSCADLAMVWKLPIVAGKNRLNILSVLNPLFHGRGPNHFDQRYIWNYNGIIVGTDPVAVDSVGLRIIQAKRLDVFKETRDLETPPTHIVSADKKHHLGTSDPAQIELIKLGWKEGILI
jgi:hypothetical protein